MPSYKLTYFPLPGRAECARIMFAYAAIPLEDNRIVGPAWMEFKPKTTFGQMPVLEVDGKMVAQSAAIDRYVAKICGLYPADPLECALADQVYAHVGDCAALFAPTFAIQDNDAKIAARKAICDGALKGKMAQLSTLIESKPGKYIAGDAVSFGDIVIFATLSNLASGFLEGIPKDFVNEYPVIKAHRNLIAALPAIAANYENETEGFRTAFKVIA